MHLKLAVKPYIQKFLTRKLGADYKLSNDDIFGRYLVGLLRSPRSDRQYEDYLSRYTQVFPVRIVPYLLADRACKNCSAQTVIHFNAHCEGIFYEEFHQFVQARVEDNLMQAKEAILLFTRRHHLTEDDVAYETLKRNWGRYWKKEKKRLYGGENPPSLSLAA